MSTPMRQQANAVLDGVSEGTMLGMFEGIRAVCPGSSNAWIIAEMKKVLGWAEEEFDYWLNWLGLEKR